MAATKKRKLHSNRFTGARCACPRCGKTVHPVNFIVNTNVNSGKMPMPVITFNCTECGDAVQVVMAGESVGAVDRPWRKTQESAA